MSVITIVIFALPIHPQRPPLPGNARALLWTIPCMLYLAVLTGADPYFRAIRGKKKQEEGRSIECFRNQELRRIKDYLDPFHRFLGRRNMEKVSERMSHSQNEERRLRGEPELPDYQPVLEPWSEILAWLGPKGPNHLYTMIRD